MFTGIIEHMGRVGELKFDDISESGGNGCSLTIVDSAPILGDAHLGDSISINGMILEQLFIDFYIGTCLTITEFDQSTFKLGLSPETLRRTNLGDLTLGSLVNLERAMASQGRFGGHFVQGHVDTTAKIVSMEPDDNSLVITLCPDDRSVMKYIVEKGYVCVDGTSLTVTSVTDSEFSIMIIAYTQAKIALPIKKRDDRVNIEVDIMGKYIEKQLVWSKKLVP
ncbi:Riboflavin synthase [Neolecta irregularis DAH-3]|uniref:Riboflavin synthase n=1 Tax=Neolecta irregularis (strain DAH-3) TaxID=1198029 RepID=A0A1U7LUZ4_NEOID|nr:Riboflavin synthase [Neolecta irregularis DAH-3]|eukprot:OLL26438.1 Riboflavin synthase [Neolecta irregularis DAH-3]